MKYFACFYFKLNSKEKIKGAFIVDYTYYGKNISIANIGAGIGFEIKKNIT